MISLAADPRTITAADFPGDASRAEQWRFLLNYALLAPSEYNTQPWLFKVQGDSLEFYADRSRQLPILDPQNRELLISCGAALLNLRLAMRHFGYREELEWFVYEDLSTPLVRLRFGPRVPATPEEEQLFAAIPHRHTSRQIYEDRPLPARLLQSLCFCAEHEGVWLHIIQEEKARQEVAQLIVAGDRFQWADQRFRQELAHWVRARGEQQADGLPGYAQAKGSLAGKSSPWIVRTFDLWREEAERDQGLVVGAPVLLVLGTFSDTPGDWMMVGQAAECILLRACAQGVQASFVNQPVEVPSLRAWLAQIVGEAFPQLVIRLGYGAPALPTPRRSVQEVLLE
ncbi:MAG TPA: hypothetical protein VKV37_11985 [Ktedonobacteraceae bacterium]|nr:hypothetical protein [Ktedonobacteraceae bacterium]